MAELIQMSGVPGRRSPWVWQEKQQSVCTAWARHAGLWASGLGTHPTPSLGGPDARGLMSAAPLPLVDAPRGGGAHIPAASSLLVPSACCPSAEPPSMAAFVPLKSTSPLEGTARFPTEATCLFPPPRPHTQPRGGCATVGMPRSSGTQ